NLFTSPSRNSTLSSIFSIFLMNSSFTQVSFVLLRSLRLTYQCTKSILQSLLPTNRLGPHNLQLIIFHHHSPPRPLRNSHLYRRSSFCSSSDLRALASLRFVSFVRNSFYCVGFASGSS